MKVAAYQAPLEACDDVDRVLQLIRAQVDRCEAEGAEILCCPEGVLGGLADYAVHPTDRAIGGRSDELNMVLAPLASDTVTTIVGFTEVDGGGRLFNAAAVFSRGAVVGVYRKQHPAIRRSVYDAGMTTPVFTVNGLTFGIVICLDSTFSEPARSMAVRGATVLFVPTNNGLPPGMSSPQLVVDANRTDIALATAHRVMVVRADVAGRTDRLESHGSTAITDRGGTTVRSARRLATDLIHIDTEISELV